MVARINGRPPGGDAGTIAVSTAALRPDDPLAPAAIIKARRLRKVGVSIQAIAVAFGASEEAVARALSAMRTPKAERTRYPLNVTLATHAFVFHERREREPVWATMERLLNELIERRALKR